MSMTNQYPSLRISRIICPGLLAVLLGLGAGCATSPSPRTTSIDEAVFFPPPPATARIQFLTHLRGAQDFAVTQKPLMDFLVGQEIEVYRTVGKPYGVTMVGNQVLVVDTMSSCVAVLDLKDRTFGQFGRMGRGELRKPINIRQGPDGNLYVSDTQRRQVVVFAPDGSYRTEYGSGQEFTPADVLVTDHELYVLDITSHSIQVYDLASRELLRTLGQRGPDPGQFNFPTNLAMGPDGNVYVSDSMNFRIQKLSPEGEVLHSFGKAGRAIGHFARPRGIAVDAQGIIYVTDAVMGLVQLFNQEGQPLMHFGSMGTGPGELMLPAQIVIDTQHLEKFRDYIHPDFDAEYLILVTNQLEENKVSVFAFGQLSPPSTAPTVSP